MATTSLTRTERAGAIVERQECIPVDDIPGLFQVRDTATGSGAYHLASADRCDCYDALRRVCKHQLAVRRTEGELAAYAQQWDAAARDARQNMRSNRTGDTPMDGPRFALLTGEVNSEFF